MSAEPYADLFQPIIDRCFEIVTELSLSASNKQQKGKNKMSIENDLNRIANALEKLVDAKQVNITTQPYSAAGDLIQAATAASSVFTDPATEAPAPAVAPPAKKAGRPAGPKSAPAEPATEAKAVTRDDVMDLMREYVRKLGQEKGPIAGKELLGKFGAGRISELDPKHFAAAFAELQKALK